MNGNDEENGILTRKLTRRTLMILGAQTAGAVSLASLNAALSTPAYAGEVKSLNVISWGGAYEVSQINAYQKPYTKKNGVRFNNIEKSASGPALVTAQEQTGNVSWDVVDMIQSPAERLYSEGLVHELDYDKDLAPGPKGEPATEDFIKGSLGGNGKTGGFVSTIAYDTLFAYNKTAFPKDNPPTSVKDVFDLENFPGTRVLHKSPTSNLEWALYADGVPRHKIYDVLRTPQGVDRAFKKLDTIKSQVMWWTEGAQPAQWLAQKQAVIGSAFNGRIFNAIVANHQALGFIWDGAYYVWDGWIIPAGLPKDRLEAAKKFVRFSTDTASLARQARYIAYAPARRSSVPLISTYYKAPHVKMMPYMPTTPAHLKVAIAKDVTFWTNYGPQLKQRFSAWLAS